MLNNINQTSFKAKFITPATIKELHYRKESQDKVVSLIELKAKSFKDRQALSNVDSLWGKGETFACNIAHDANEDNFIGGNSQYFALTTQRRQFEEPVSDKILGIAEVLREKDDLIQLKYLQTDPEHTHFSYYKIYSGIGTSILNAIKALFPEDSIILNTVDSARGFYKDNGFVELDKLSNVLMFKRTKSASWPKLEE